MPSPQPAALRVPSNMFCSELCDCRWCAWALWHYGSCFREDAQRMRAAYVIVW